MDHIKRDLIPLLNKSKQERISFILNDLWIGYPRAHEILNKLNFLLRHPRINRMPSMLLVGETNNGKTVLLKKFINENKPFLDEDEERLTAPVLYIQAPPAPDEKRFYNSILDATFTPYRLNDKLDKRHQQVIKVLKQLDVKVLIIDEIQHILGGTISKRVSFLNVIKYMSNELRISIIGAGIHEAFNAISTDPQLINRFDQQVLPRWSYDSDFLRLLASYETLLPLRKSSHLVKDSTLNKKIFNLSEGIIGEVSSIIKKAATYAIENDIECINNEVIKLIKFAPPSSRRHNSAYINS
ncbi:TniB protein [Marivirga sericea]|uniref:TniB protein n=1 Tax=Marivirga sericea TaxID=1028 RepID=A0A1X7KN49_9BACT|nr:TniB family NTP-binding protein [Marivirga sericea]SMG42613.1 TniB protein [Marivirga sericea]